MNENPNPPAMLAGENGVSRSAQDNNKKPPMLE